MPPSTIDEQIRARIESFTHELAELVKQAAVESVQDALKGAELPARTFWTLGDEFPSWPEPVEADLT